MKIDILETLKQDAGPDLVHPWQEAVIRRLIDGGDALLAMPASDERAVCFQMAGLILAGTAVVVSPREEWMWAQVEMLRANRVAAGMPLRSMSLAERVALRDACVEGELKLLYLTQDRLPRVLPWLAGHVEVSMFVLDEAQCALDGGPGYEALVDLRERFPGVPVLALSGRRDEATLASLLSLLQMPVSAVYEGPEVPEELFEAPPVAEVPVVSEPAPQESYMNRQRRLHRNAYAKWTGEDDRTLQARFMAGASVSELAAAFNRNEGAIRSRLRKLGSTTPVGSNTLS